MTNTAGSPCECAELNSVPESEAALQRAFRTAAAGRTSLVIAHPLSMIRAADQVIVDDTGQVRKRGRREDLVGTGGLYAELHRTQFGANHSIACAFKGSE